MSGAGPSQQGPGADSPGPPGALERRVGGWESGAGLQESGAGLPDPVAMNPPCDLKVGAPSVGFGLFFLADWSGWGLSNCSLQPIWHI